MDLLPSYLRPSFQLVRLLPSMKPWPEMVFFVSGKERNSFAPSPKRRSASFFSSSAAAYAASALFMDMLLSAAESLLLPAVGAYTALLLASSALGDGRLKAAVKLLKWVCTRSLCALAALFSFVLGFTGLASGTVDAAAAKTAFSTPPEIDS